jgi:hypothetical protein
MNANRGPDAASATTAQVILAELKEGGLDALFDPVTQRRLQRCSPQVREAIRRQLSNFTFFDLRSRMMRSAAFIASHSIPTAARLVVACLGSFAARL